jgi:predicted dehydrogenase
MPLSFGLVGGGAISHKHIQAATANGRAKLAAGCFSRNAEKNAAFAKEYGVGQDRAYADYLSMAEAEARRPDKVSFVVVAVPNAIHYDVCKAFLDCGFNLACEKPLTVGAGKAEELAGIARAKGLLCLTSYTFLGSPGLHVMKALYEEGRIGKAYYIYLKYLRGARLGDIMRDPRSVWRFNAAESGPAGAVGDLGSHLDSLARFMAGPIESVIAKLVNEPNGIELDSTGTVIFKANSGLDGSMQIAQLACGYENEVAIELWGERGSLSWSFGEPGSARLSRIDGSVEVVRADGFGGPIALADPPVRNGADGHVACFQRLYDGYISALASGGARAGRAFFPDFDFGAAGVRFIDACVNSQRRGNAWAELY